MNAGTPLDPGQPTEVARQIIEILRRRDSCETSVQLRDGRTYLVMNIAWGIDAYDTAYDVTTNISPSIESYSVDGFRTDEVELIVDVASGTVLFGRGFESDVP